MKRFLPVFLLTLLCQTAFAQTAEGPKVAEDAQAPEIPGVDVCRLFSIGELRTLTGYDLEERWDHNPNVPTLVYGSDHYPEANGGRPERGEHTNGTADIPYNGRECHFRTVLGHEDPAMVTFIAYELTEQEVRDMWRTSVPARFVHPGVLRINNICLVNPTVLPGVWIGIFVTAPPLTREEAGDASCRIAFDGNVSGRAVMVKSWLVPAE